MNTTYTPHNRTLTVGLSKDEALSIALADCPPDLSERAIIGRQLISTIYAEKIHLEYCGHIVERIVRKVAG